MVSIARLSVVKQSSFGLPGQYGRRVTRVSYRRFRETNEACGSFSTALTHQPRVHAAVNKRNFAYSLTCNNNYWFLFKS